MCFRWIFALLVGAFGVSLLLKFIVAKEEMGQVDAANVSLTISAYYKNEAGSVIVNCLVKNKSDKKIKLPKYSNSQLQGIGYINWRDWRWTLRKTCDRSKVYIPNVSPRVSSTNYVVIASGESYAFEITIPTSKMRGQKGTIFDRQVCQTCESCEFILTCKIFGAAHLPNDGSIDILSISNIRGVVETQCVVKGIKGTPKEDAP